MGEVTLANTIGALEIGMLIAAFLFGLVSYQAYYYFINFPEDRLYLKVLVSTVLVLEAVHTGCAAYEVYQLTITFYGKGASPTYRYFGLASMTLFGGMITMLVHLFFCARVWKVLPKPWKYIGAVCTAAALARGAGSLVLGSRAIVSKTIVEYRTNWQWLITTLLASGASIDVIIAASMLYFLLSKRNKGLATVSKLIDRLVGYTIRTGLLTSIGALTMITVFRLMPENLVWVAIHATLAKLYSISLLSALNERHSLRTTIMSGSTSGEIVPPRSRKQGTNTRTITIAMRTTTDVDIEDDAASSIDNTKSRARDLTSNPADHHPPNAGPHSGLSGRDYEPPGSPGINVYPPTPSSVRFDYSKQY